VRAGAAQGLILLSNATFQELNDVLARPKFDRYVSADERAGFLVRLGRIAEFVPIAQRIRACRDPKDDMILEVAVNGAATAVVTGDQDLLALHPFMAIPIVSPAAWLRAFEIT
jgi:uncharacterized protein